MLKTSPRLFAFFYRYAAFSRVLRGPRAVPRLPGGSAPAFSAGRGGEDEIRAVAQKIANRNPAVLVGFNKENREAWQAVVKARKAL